MATFAQLADANASNTMGILTGRVEQVAVQTEAQMSRVATQVMQQLKKDIEAIAMSTAAMVEITTRVVVEGVRHNVQAQFQ